MSSQRAVSIKEEPLFVLFVDISKWSQGDASEQQIQIVALSQAAMDVFSHYGLIPRWKAGTGDGFAVAFPLETSPTVAIQIACSLFESIHTQHKFKIRLALT
jgi:hypothetical protein